MRMTGVDKPSGRLEVRLADQPGELARLTGLLAARGLNIHSILTHPDGPRVDPRGAARRVDRDPRARPGPEAREFDVVWPPEKPSPMASVIYHPAYRSYSFGDDHPFSPLRLDMTLELCAALGHPLETVAPEPASREDLLGVHEDYYVRRVEALSAGEEVPDREDYGLGTPDTPAFPGMDEAAAGTSAGRSPARAASSRRREARPPARRRAPPRAAQLRVGLLRLQRPGDRDPRADPARASGSPTSTSTSTTATASSRSSTRTGG